MTGDQTAGALVQQEGLGVSEAVDAGPEVVGPVAFGVTFGWLHLVDGHVSEGAGHEGESSALYPNSRGVARRQIGMGRAWHSGRAEGT